jgi:hypothetical protein
MFTVLAPRLALLKAAPNPVDPGSTVVVTATLGTVGASDIALPVASDQAGVVAPFSISISAGSLTGSATVPVLNYSGATAQYVNLTGTLGEVSQTTRLTVATNSIDTISLDSSSIAEGNTANLSVNLAFPAAGVQKLLVTSSVPSLIPSFSGSATNSLTASIPVVSNFTGIAGNQNVKLTVAFADASGNPVAGARTMAITITLMPIVLSLSPAATTIRGGASFAGTILLSAPLTTSSTYSVNVTSNKPGIYFLVAGAKVYSLPVVISNAGTNISFTMATDIRVSGTVVSAVKLLNQAGAMLTFSTVTITP